VRVCRVSPDSVEAVVPLPRRMASEERPRLHISRSVAGRKAGSVEMGCAFLEWCENIFFIGGGRHHSLEITAPFLLSIEENPLGEWALSLARSRDVDGAVLSHRPCGHAAPRAPRPLATQHPRERTVDARRRLARTRVAHRPRGGCGGRRGTHGGPTPEAGAGRDASRSAGACADPDFGFRDLVFRVQAAGFRV